MQPIIDRKPIKDWTSEERIEVVKRIFNAVTPHYDKLNHIMSARQDVKWRRFTASRLTSGDRKVLDVATGTGDLAIDITSKWPDTEVIGVDFVRKMMQLGRDKVERKGLANRILYAASDALSLPFQDNEFDVATIAFGLRNIPDRLAALKEMVRVVKPGGKVITLEMTFPRNMGFRWFFKWYLNNVMPLIGRLISGNSEAYRYLPASIQDFLHPDDLTKLYQLAGLTAIHAIPLTLGITYMHEGIVANNTPI
jgi:demethylmenaquinone methyltransferase/2-methoxy-6-polyprenyl-1,4-benzoquinol methylase